MNDAQWQKAWEIYSKAMPLAGEERRLFLASCNVDAEVLEEVSSMLEEAEESAADSLSGPRSRSGARFGRYEVGELLSSGGMGEVYLANDSELGRKVALKFLNPRMAASRSAMDRLIREAQAASALNHPHIITVYEVIRAEEDVAIAMELVEGQALRHFCGKPVEVAQVVQWGRQIAQALGAAHQRNMIHRDVKPENLMVRDDGIVKVLDFGLARRTGGDERMSTHASGLSGGTLSYMSPEQTRGEAATSAGDVFALGLVLYELATGTHPFRSGSPIDTAEAIAHAEAKPPSSLHRAIPAALDALLLRMLHKDPKQRPPAMEVDQQLSVVSLPRSSRRLAWVAAAFVILAVTGGLLFTLRGRQARRVEPTFVQLTRQVNENRVTAAALSPDGKSLVFATFSGAVYWRRMSEGLSQPLSALRGLRVDRMVWFEDGARILINGSAIGPMDEYLPGIWVMAMGGGLEQVAVGANNGVPSPDGKRIAMTSTDGSVLSIVSLKGGKPREIRNGGETGSFSSLVWSPDGRRVGYQKVEYVLPANVDSDPKSFLALHRYRYKYEAVDVDSGQVMATADNFVMESACGLRDGSILFLRNTVEQSFTYHLFKMRTDPQSGKIVEPPRQYTQEDYQLKEISASAEGKEVVAVRRVNGHPNIYVADLPASGQYPRFLNIRRLTFADADEYPHTWTSDVQSVIFESRRNGGLDLFRQDIDQSDAQPLVVSNKAKAIPRLSPDGKWILYNEEVTKQHWSVMRVPVAGGTPETVLSDAGALPGEFTCSTQSAGRCVVRTVENDQFLFWELDPMRGRGRMLASTRWSPAIIGDWDIAPDGSQIAIPNHDPREARIRLVPLDTRAGTIEKIVTIKGLKNLSGVVWAADGRGWYVAVNDIIRGHLHYVDLQGRVLTDLLQSMSVTYAVPSPDSKRVAFMDWTVAANVWLIQGL